MKSSKKLLLVLGLLLLAAALVWAAVELSGHVNSLAQDSGSRSADMETLTMDSIRKPTKTATSPKPPPCDWKKERSIRKSLEANDAKYKQLRAKAQSEMSATGNVTSGTRQAVLSTASAYKSLCEQYAAMWDACNCRTRAKTARATGESRVRSAIVVVSDMDNSTQAAMRTAQKNMREARREYAFGAAEAKELSAEDQADIRANLIPRVQTFIQGLTDFLNKIGRFITDAQSGFFGGGSESGGGGGGGSEMLDQQTQKAVTQARSVQSTGTAMLADAKDLLSDVKYLAGGPKPTTYQLLRSRFLPCFIESASE
jgi:hypothetical protein